MEIKKFKEKLIAFDLLNDVVNATDMAKVYNKKPADFLRLKETKAFIDALKSDMNEIHITYETVKGRHSDGRSQGTWMGELLAIKFAAWLDPNFELFIYKVFQNELKTAIDNLVNKNKRQQLELDYFWDKEDNTDLYGDMTE